MPPSSLDATTWERVTECVGQALDRPPEERAAFIADLDPPHLGTEVAALVAAHEAAEATDALTSTFHDAPEPEPGTRLGRYRVTGRLGAGGMGTVYRAVRDDGTHDREVALKVVRHGGAALTGRFAREQRALARLEHPGIARLYDAGVADEGALGKTPFLALELVEGEPITDAADQLALGVRQRVALLRQVAEAVAYAHSRLVLHRDLKPSNVLVTTDERGDPRAVVLDFGIARLLGDDPTLTAGAMTPAYAAPEQRSGGEVTTASDVYGLGVLLYEVLTGHRPDSADTATEVPPPSTVSPDGARALAGDLDTICLKALSPEPDQRYVSAQALADDLGRHLNGIPVQARPATRRYRASRFIRRHRAGVAAAGIAVTALALGLGVALWQGRQAADARDQAQARFEVAQEAARAMLYDVHDAVAGLPGSTPARETIVANSLDYLERLAEQAGDDPALRIDLAGAYLRIGNVQGMPTGSNLGRPGDALQSYARGLTLLRALPSDLSDSLASAAASVEGSLWEKRGVVLAHTVGPDSARASLDRAVTLQRRALSRAPADPDRRAALAAAFINRADYAGHPYFPNAGDADAALADYARARAIAAPGAEGTTSLFAMRMWGVTFEREGTLLRHLGRLDDALDPTLQAARVRRQIAARPDANVDARREEGIAHETLAFLLSDLGRPADAYPEFVQAQAVYDALLAADPDDVRAQQTVGIGHLNIARFLAGPGWGLGRRTEARRYAQQAARRWADLARLSPDDAQTQSRLREADSLRSAP